MTAGVEVAAGTSGPRIEVTSNVPGAVQIGDHNIQINKPNGSVIVNRIEPVRRRLDAGPLPGPPDPFVGRETERQRLAEVIAKAVATGRSVGACVAGGEGAGRSSLLKRVAADAARPGGVLVALGLGEGAPLAADDIAQQLFDLVWETEPRDKVTVEKAATELQDVDAIALVYDAALRDDDIVRLAGVLPRGVTLLSTRSVPYGADVASLPVGPLSRTAAVELLAARAGISAATEPEALDAI